MLTQFVYTSRPCFNPATASGNRVLGSIVESARRNNAASAISGILIVGGEWFAQVLEGERQSLNPVITRILADERHKDRHIAGLRFLPRRRFPKWSLGLARSPLPALPIDRLAEMSGADFMKLAGVAPLAEVSELC